MTATFAEQDGTFKVCVDTGASLSMIDRRLWEKHFSHIPPQPEPLITVSGVGGRNVIAQSLPLTMVLQDTRLHASEIPTKFYINPSEQSRIILGNDFMVHHGVAVDIGNQVITLTRNTQDDSTVKIPITTWKEPFGVMRATEAFTIKGFHTDRI